EWPCATRALLRSYGAASGHVGPKSFPGVAPRRLRFGHSSTTNRNGGQYKALCPVALTNEVGIQAPLLLVHTAKRRMNKQEWSLDTYLIGGRYPGSTPACSCAASLHP